MIGVGFGVFFAGYSLLVYGWSQLRGRNASLVSLVWPGSYRGDFPDQPRNPPPNGGGAPPSATNPNPPNPLRVPAGGVNGKTPANDTPFGAGVQQARA